MATTRARGAAIARAMATVRATATAMARAIAMVAATATAMAMAMATMTTKQTHCMFVLHASSRTYHMFELANLANLSS